MKSRLSIQLIVLTVIISACTSQSPQVSPAVTPSIPATSSLDSPTPILDTVTPHVENTGTATDAPTLTSTPTQQATITPTTSPSPSLEVGPSNTIIIDHTSLESFEKIPDEYIEAASQLSLLFRHASVGWNIKLGLDCLMDVQPRKAYCDSGIPTSERLRNSKYNWTNWTFEYHQPPPEQNPGWYNKVRLFIERVDSLTPAESYDYAGFKLGYIDALPGSEIANEFFKYPNSTYPTIKDLEDLEARHQEITFIYWTLALGRAIGSAESDSFNQQLREYAVDHNTILMDIADIESHTLDGAPCFDNAGQGHEAICDEYTDEKNAGHLNALGSLRAAKAMWVLMARLAGWDGIPK